MPVSNFFPFSISVTFRNIKKRANYILSFVFELGE